ncbi:D-alanyl-D-alanine carboxypeptidase/D-alanyl-D-alanine-endopeptidase [Ruminobacter sp. RM87]|uniref:D-alanyl-D-alanine carboxypeptidase/D-alanyl-D-alanine endopeptidase n=1 Tax=Ruminobacter sp. RM87 TaxID=1200567 RepID=UPI00068B82E1|nr:D-alanyl-D-alanine carboxypeptidase/D-alanyl-D-alanine-endopeptidase [Ruminobacter sp. RM87]
MLNLKNIALSLCATMLFSAASADELSEINSKMPSGAANGVAYSYDDLASVYGQNMDDYYRPASTQKVITALAALLYLGPNYQIKTRLLVNNNAISSNGSLFVNNGVLNGDIELEFRGDPQLKRTDIKNLLDTLRKAGVRKINGTLYLNYGYFAGHDYAEGWSWDDLSKCFTAPPASIIIDGNCTSIQLHAKTIGGPVTAVVPANTPITVDTTELEVVTASEFYGGCSLDMQRDSHNVYRLSGCIPVQKKEPLGISVAIQDPNEWGQKIVSGLIRDLGITVSGGVKLTRKTKGVQIQYASYLSQPMHVMLKRCLLKSVNIIADSVAKTIGTVYYNRPANYYMSSIAIRNILKKHDIYLGNATVIDGSGLSPHNLITPRQMLNVLEFIKLHNDEIHMIELLPVAGVSGTLGGRGSLMKAPLLKNVTAKTGTLDGVSNLAGFLKDNKGRTVPFVYFMNNLSYDEKTRQMIHAKRISKPHYPHERMILEAIYNDRKFLNP